MKRLTIDEMKIIQVELLKSFVKYCENNKLEYFLCAGTLIGCVRHNGFIPWDDDIDVMMPRDSYEKFIKSYKDSRYVVFDCWSRDDYYYPFAKLADSKTIMKENTNVNTCFGVYIDVFPIDTLPSSKLRCKLLYLKRLYLDAKMSSKTAIEKPRSFTRNLLYKFAKIVFKNNDLVSTVRQIDTFSKKYLGQKTLLSGRIASGYGMKEVMNNNVYHEYITGRFEGLECRIPKYYDLILKSIYGDYMKLPPVEQQVNKHDTKAYRV